MSEEPLRDSKLFISLKKKKLIGDSQISDFKASVFYRASSRTVIVTQRNPISKNKKTKQAN